jgi:signal transduction histidine kinase
MEKEEPNLPGREELQRQLIRERQIESALEKVRARTMAMQRSEELVDTADLLFKQLKELGIEQWANSFQLWDDDKKAVTTWTCTKGLEVQKFKIPTTEDPIMINIVHALRKGETLYVESMGGEALKTHYEYMFSLPTVRDVFFGQLADAGFTPPKFQIFHAAFFSYGYILFITYKPYPEAHDIFKRFAKVFEQTYTRFLDLQKAETQARESQIQLALERIRARTMAMQKSDELAETVSILFKQLIGLGISATQMRTCAIVTLRPEEPIGECWITNPDGGIIPESFTVPYDETSAYKTIYEAWKQGEKFLVVHLAGDALQQHLDFLKKYAKIPTQQFQATRDQPTDTFTHAMFFSQGYLFIISNEPLPAYHEVFKRIGSAFEQTYTRFLDLQKAETQTRESQVQLALERVRSRTMAMQKSTELSDAAFMLFQQFQMLGEDPIQITIGIMNEIERVIEFSVTDWAGGGGHIDHLFKGSFDEPALINKSYVAWKENKKSLIVDLQGDELEAWISYRNKISDSTVSKDDTHGRRVVSIAYFSKGHLSISTPEPRPRETIHLLERFAGEFDLTYTRFLDLQKAESQARESEIQLALERIRGRSMAMQKTAELKEIIQLVFAQLVQLNIKIDQAGFVMDYKEGEGWNIWIADQIGVPSKSYIPYFDSPQWNRFIEAKQKGRESFTNSLTFEEKNYFFQMIFKYISGVPEEIKEYVYSTPGFATSNALLKNISLFVNNFSGIQYSDEESVIVMRFASVFEQTYTRFKDLKHAEEQAMEATKRASVDRIRAEIASMRTTRDLERITPLIWNELTTIGVPFVRCGVFIMDEEPQIVHTFLSTPEGNGIAASFHLPYYANPETTEIVTHWQRKEMYRPHWDEAAFIDFTKILTEKGAITTGEKYLIESRPSDLYLHFIPFLQGMLYVGDTAPLSVEHLELVQALAEAFSTAYARYEDFNKLESAKAQIEKTLVDLRQAQAQLVQSEKMASLGELTAGIAHEIQNPLNFVNNFSEVNTELLGEMIQQIDEGNYEEVKIISNDIKENEIKITFHGRRADAIVKGMLQHSQSNTGKGELTDINALTDEYQRLAFHGLRAKDKSFNATLKTDYDQTIGLVNLVPQDIGRVLLNLYNNAFYAVTEKKKQENGSYEPTVSFSTKKINGKVEIRVKDNGNGIPQKILDKIFQPFFTTKPTGQGTGLGLSLSYDIIKAHGGDIRVDTREGEFTEFVVQIPVV